MSELIKRQDAINAVSRQYRYESDRMTALQNVAVVTEQEIRARAIEEFAERLKKKYEHCVVNDILMNNDVMSYTNSCSVFESFIDEIAEEMRGAV